jgi:gamma-polyglutamate synthase
LAEQLDHIIRDIGKNRSHKIEWDACKPSYLALIEMVESIGAIHDERIQLLCIKPEKILWALALKQVVQDLLERGQRLTQAYDGFAREFSAEPDPDRRLALGMDFLRTLRRGRIQSRKTKRALRPNLDLDLFYEGYRLQMEDFFIQEEKAFFCIGHLIADGLTENLDDPIARVEILRYLLEDLGFEELAAARVRDGSRELARVAALAMLARVGALVPADAAIFSLTFLRNVLSISQQSFENVWLQIEALRLMTVHFGERALEVFRLRLFAPSRRPDQNLFIRAWMVRTITERFRTEAGFAVLSAMASDPDPSEHVRMAVVTALGEFGYERSAATIRPIFLPGPDRDDSPQVRARCSEALCQGALIDRGGTIEAAAQDLVATLETEQEMFARRISMEEMVRLITRPDRTREVGTADKLILNAISRLIEDDSAMPKVRYWAGAYKESILFALDHRLGQALQRVADFTSTMRQGDEKPLSSELAEMDPRLLGRTLAHLGLKDFGYYLRRTRRGLVLEKGERFRFQLWRLLHEMSNPSPEKRRNFRHTKGRQLDGPIRAHSDILGELTATKVPGEPLVVWDEGSWRRHIPLVDDCLGLLRPLATDRNAELYSSFGITVIQGPEKPRERFKAYLRLLSEYSRLALLRNSHPGNKQYPDVGRYTRELRENFGVKVRFLPYSDTVGGESFAPCDPAIARIFGAG